MQQQNVPPVSPLVSTDWLAAQVGNPDLRVFDCSIVRQDNPDGSYALVSGREQWSHSHIPGSAFLGLREELSDPASPTRAMMPPVDKLAALLMAKGVDEGSCVVLYDSGNHACAARAWWMLKLCGFDNCFVLNGGWRKWCAEGRAVSNVATVFPAGSFTVRPRPQLLADKHQVQAALADSSTLLVHALPPPVFSGAVRVFARAGRIPGSRNVFCDWLIDSATATYLEPENLRGVFGPSAALDAPRVITYCGGGIAASSVALALVSLGCNNVALYDGSLAEWTADPALPLESDYPA